MQSSRYVLVSVPVLITLAFTVSACSLIGPRAVGTARLPSAQGTTFCATTKDGRPIAEARARRIDQLDVYIRRAPSDIEIAKRSHRPDLAASLVDSLATALREWDIRTGDIVSCDGTSAPLPAFTMERQLVAERSPQR